MQQPSVKPNQIESFSDSSCFSIDDNPIEKRSCNAVLISWPPAEVNPSQQVIGLQPKLIIYVFTNHVDETTGVRQTGSKDMLTTLANDYRLVDQWEVHRPKDLLHEIWPDMTPSIEETRQVHIYAHSSLIKFTAVQSLPPAQPYDWEIDLQMALLALQAKQEVQSRGFPVK